MNNKPVLVPIASLRLHPQNPRLVPREEVISAIELQIRTSGFSPSHAITVRPLNGHNQIIGGHNRTEAARRAGLKEIPAWVEEMDDDTALMRLVLDNEQAELTPLERGFHALAVTSAGTMTQQEYAKECGVKQPTICGWIQAAKVARASLSLERYSELSDYIKHLEVIHKAEACWPALVQRLLDGKWTVEATVAAVKAVNAVKPPRGYETLFEKERLRELVAAGQDIADVTGGLIRNIERARADLRDGYNPEKYLALFESWLAEHGPWDDTAIFTEKKRLAAEQAQERQEIEQKAAKLKRAVTLTEWKTLALAEQKALLAVRDSKAKLNPQKTEDIEWAKWSTNPVTGCLHNCPYCYARVIAHDIYAHKFEPALVPSALAAPLNAIPPKEAGADISYKNIFLCSMADLFGNWVPKEWIDEVLAIVRQAKQWNFLMLTKFPQRLKEFEFPDNAWLGTTVDLQARVVNAERAMREVKAKVKWLSLEPLIEPLKIDFSIFQWVVIGGASAVKQTPESAASPIWQPPRQWVMDLTARAMDAKCAVYHKTNLNPDRMRNYPGFLQPEPPLAPAEFNYLKVIAS